MIPRRPPSSWVKIRYPRQFKMPLGDFAKRCDWILHDRDGEMYIVPGEIYRKETPRLIDIAGSLECGASPEEISSSMRRWTSESEIVARPPDGFHDEEIERRLALGTDPGFIAAVGLMLLCYTDDRLEAELPNVLEGFEHVCAGSKFVLLRLSRVAHTRSSAIAALFSDEHVPEHTDTTRDFAGFTSMRGLSSYLFDAGNALVAPVMGALAPDLIGFPFSRISDMAVVLAASPVTGRDSTHDTELIGVLRSSARNQEMEPLALPRSLDGEAVLRWWLVGVNGLLSAVLDPTLFQDADGWYEPERHYGHLISAQRFFACVQTVLVHAHRDNFSRRLALFEALDLLEGMQLGMWDVTTNPGEVAVVLQNLENSIPEQVGSIVLPRCRRAVRALEKIKGGFIADRVDNGQLRVVRDGAEEWISLDKAVTRLLRQVRNSGHGMQRVVADDRHLSVLAAHDGEIGDSVADLAFLHLVRCIANPEIMRRPFLRTGRV